MLRKGTAKGAATDDDDVEELGIWAAVHTRDGLVEAVADVASKNIAAKVGVLRSSARHTSIPPGFCRPAVPTGVPTPAAAVRLRENTPIPARRHLYKRPDFVNFWARAPEVSAPAWQSPAIDLVVAAGRA